MHLLKPPLSILNLKQQITNYFFGRSTYNIQDIAIKGMQEGYDSPSIWILAGLEKNESPSMIDYYFHQTLIELKIELPTDRKAALEYIITIIDDIISGDKEIIIGTNEIIDNVFMTFDFFSENKIYCYDSIGFEKAYGLYDTYDDLYNADYNWQPGKTNQQLMTEVKEELLDELIKWKCKITGA